MIQLRDIAHYGRWFPYYEREYDLWWFDKSADKVVSAEELSEMLSCNVHSLKDALAEQENSDYLPLFRVDIPTLEMEYAQAYLSGAEVKRLKNMPAKDMDREFQIAIEQVASTQHWYHFELDRLCAAAKQWCEQNHISCKCSKCRR